MPLEHKSPDETLLRELQEVAEDAQTLHEAVRSANALPVDFPTSQLIAIAASLSELPVGTAEGCRVPLEYARARLPAIRREFIQSVDSTATTQSSSADTPPPALRGEDLDRRLRNLISSVTTALDEYRRQATEESADSDVEEPSLANHESATITIAVDQATTVDKELGEARRQIYEHAIANRDKPDLLVRNMVDAQNLSKLAGAELGLREVVAKWYGNISDAIQSYPSIIRGIGNGIEVGVDVAEPFVHWWHNLWADIETRSLHHLKEFAAALKKVAQELDERRKGKDETKNTRIVAADDGYWPKQRIKDYFIEGRHIPASVAEEVTDLAFGNVSVKLRRIDRIGQFVNLRWLGSVTKQTLQFEEARRFALGSMV